MWVRDIDGSDIENVRRMVASLWKGDDLWRPGRADPYEVDAGCIVGVDRDGLVVGVASYRPSQLPKFGVLQLDVGEGWQRAGIGTALLAEVRARYPGDRMMMRVRPWDQAATQFGAKHGFEVAERVVEGCVDPSASALSEWIDLTKATIPLSVHVQPASDSQWSRQAVGSVLERWFHRHHEWLGSPDLPAARAAAYCLDTALEGTLQVAAVSGELVGVGALVPDPFQHRDGRAHLVYLGVGTADRPDERVVVAGLVAHCLAAARDQKRRVQVEIQHHHHALYAVTGGLPTDALYDGLVVLVAP